MNLCPIIEPWWHHQSRKLFVLSDRRDWHSSYTNNLNHSCLQAWLNHNRESILTFDILIPQDLVIYPEVLFYTEALFFMVVVTNMSGIYEEKLIVAKCSSPRVGNSKVTFFPEAFGMCDFFAINK